MPKVSIVIPTYNNSNYICEAIDSVLNQTYQDFEIIVVDDGSTDDTRTKLKQYDTKINCIYQENLGPSAARNKGIKLAKGEYIAFLDADDSWLPEKLELQVSYLDRHPDIGLVTCDASAFNNERIVVESMAKERPLHSGWVFVYLLKENFLNTDNVLIRKNVFDQVGLFDGGRRFSEDYDLWLRISRQFRIGCINKVLTKYRIHDSNRSLIHKNKVSEAHLDLVHNYFSSNSKLSLLQKKSIASHNYYKLGYNFFCENEKEVARQYFIQSLIHNPFKFKAYLYLLVSFLTTGEIEKLKNLKRKMTFIK